MTRVDCHVHALMRESLFFFRGRPDETTLAGRPDETLLARRPGDILTNQVSIAGWIAAGIGLAVVALYSPPFLHRGRGHLRELMRQAEAVSRWAQIREDQIAVARSPAEARRIIASGRTAFVLQIEGGHGIAAPEDVLALHTAGVRVITLAHLRDNALAGAAASRHLLDGPNYAFVSRRREGDARDRDGRIWLNRRGLSHLGTEVVREMQKLGMMIDLAHASDRTFADVVELTRSDSTPLLVTHTGSRPLWPSERNIGDDQARAIVERRGVIGVTLWRRLLGVESDRRPPGFVPGTIDGYVAHFKRLSEVTRSQAVVLGSDFNGMVWRPKGSPACPHGMRHVGDLPALERALKLAGAPDEQLERSAEPVLVAWEGVEALASDRQRAGT